MASSTENLYVTFVDVDRDLLKVWGQRNRVGATFIEKQLLHLVPEFKKTQCPNPLRIRKGMFCFAKYTDDNYYRARVISTVQGDCVAVLFVDYGNKDLINISNIRIQEGREGDVLAKMAEQAEEYYLARVVAPLGGWTKTIVSDIRRDICCDEFVARIVDQVGDQKVLEIQFHNQGFSDLLIKKQFARPITLASQKQMILSYCSLVPNEQNSNSIIRDMPELNFPKPSVGVPNPGGVKPPQSINMMNEHHEAYNYGKQTNPVNFSQPPPSVPAHYASSRHVSSMVQNTAKIVPPRAFYPSTNIPNIPNNHVLRNESQMQPMNPQFSPMPSNQFNPPYQMKANPDMPLLNNVVIEALAHQIKQYITEDNAKSGSEAENIPHNYVSSVLEVGSTHNVFISNIDDGPWSFSIQLLSSESELNKLMEELASIELIPVKPPLILGHPCIGASAVYENLCRGVIVSISHSAVKVYFVDFGSTEDLPVTSIFELPPKFFKTRVLSQKFSLSGLQKVSYSDDIKRCFREVVQDELLMLRVTSLEGDNLPTCELYHKDRNIKRLLNEKIRDLKTSHDELPKVGETVDVVVTWVDSPQKFFVQLRSKDAELSALKKELAKAPRSYQPLGYQELCIGLRCICQYLSDEQWYRAVITSLSAENGITVFYIDYGNMETVPISLLRKMDSYGLVAHMGVQAIQCALKGFENKPVDPAVSRHLVSLILEKDLKMKVVSADKNCLTVELYENDEDIASALLAYSQKINMPQTNDNVSGWKDIGDSNRQTPNKNDQKFRYSGGGDSFERKEKSFRGETDRPNFSREKNFNNRSFPESDKFQSTHTQTKRRYEDKREDYRKTGDRSFKQDRENSWNDKRTFGGNGGGGGGGGSDKSSWNRDRDRGAKQTDGWTDSRRNDSADSSDWRDRSSNKWKWDESKGQKKKFDDNRTDRSFGSRDGRQNDSGGKKKFREDRHASGDDVKSPEERRPPEVDMKWPDDRRPPEGDKGSAEVKIPKRPMRMDEIVPPRAAYFARGFELKERRLAVVSFFESPDSFYVQVLDQEEEFKNMMDDIQEYYKDKYPLREPVKKCDMVIAEFSDDKVLYRAEVVQPKPTTVFYVDYGNQEAVQPRAIWPVARQFAKLPAQAIHCRLAFVKPAGSGWSPKTELMKYFQDDAYRIKFVFLESGVYSVTMENLETRRDVATELIDAGLAVLDKPEKTVEVTEVDFRLLPKQMLKLFVTHVESSSKFYAILNPPAVKTIEMEIKNYAEDDDEILRPLNESCLKPGTRCLSTNDDIVWHRGTITQIIDNRVILRFDDRGDSVNVTTNKVMFIPDYLKKIQPQAFECYLDGVAEDVSQVDEEDFKNVVEQRFHNIHIKSVVDGKLCVVLYDLNGFKCSLQNNDSPGYVEPLAQLPILSQGIPVDVSHVESPEEVYVQIPGHWEEIDDLTRRLGEFYEDANEDDDEVVEDVTAGMLVAARSYEHAAWYRARVLDTGKEDVNVFYIDYGNTEKLQIGNVRRLDPSFYDKHMYAAKVSLPVKFDRKLKEELVKKITKIFRGKDAWAYFLNDGEKLYADFIINDWYLREEWKRMDGIVPLKELFKDVLPDEDALNESVEGGPSVKPAVKIVKSSLNSIKNVFVSHIDSPSQFWVHQEGSIHQLNNLQEKLESQCLNSPEKENYETGEVVAVYYSGMWYRAEVIKVEDKKLTVKFIDYGNVLSVDPTLNPVKELTPDLLKVPVFATRYSLRGTWNDSFTSKFEEIIMQFEDPVKAVIYKDDEDPKIVDLFKDGYSIAERLMGRKPGQLDWPPQEEDLPTVYITHGNSPADFYIQRESCTEILDELSDRLSKPECFEDVSFVQENEIYAAKFAEDGAWYRARVIRKRSDGAEVIFIDYGNTSNVTELKRLPDDISDIQPLSENCYLLHGERSDGWSQSACDKFAEYCDGRPLKMKVISDKWKRLIVKLFLEKKDITQELDCLCEKDGREEVYVSYVNSPTDFYIQYVDDAEFRMMRRVIGQEKRFENLDERTPGKICLARFDVDGLWYRAKILQSFGRKCEVFFIDYGNASVSTRLKKLPPKLEEVPPRALRCSLNLPETNIPESVKEEFIALTEEGVFRLKIITPGDVNIVSLKLNGRILEETLLMDDIPERPERNDSTYDDLSRPDDLHGSLDDETDDDKNSKKIGMSEHYQTSNFEDDAVAGSSVRNETDEEKRVKIASGVVDGGLEGFKSDDEKGISESGVLSSIVNVTDNELIEESQEESREIGEESQETVEESTGVDRSNDGHDERVEVQEVVNEVSVENDIDEENPEQEPHSEIKTENEDTVQTSTDAEGTVIESLSEGNKDESLLVEEKEDTVQKSTGAEGTVIDSQSERNKDKNLPLEEKEDTVQTSTGAEGTVIGSQSEGNKDDSLPVEEKENTLQTSTGVEGTVIGSQSEGNKDDSLPVEEKEDTLQTSTGAEGAVIDSQSDGNKDKNLPLEEKEDTVQTSTGAKETVIGSQSEGSKDESIPLKEKEDTVQTSTDAQGTVIESQLEGDKDEKLPLEEKEDTVRTSTDAEGTVIGSQSKGNKDESLPLGENKEESKETVTKEQN